MSRRFSDFLMDNRTVSGDAWLMPSTRSLGPGPSQTRCVARAADVSFGTDSAAMCRPTDCSEMTSGWHPHMGKKCRSNAAMSELFPLPVRPQMPTLCPSGTVKLIWRSKLH